MELPGEARKTFILPTRRKPPLLLPCHGIGFQRKEFGDFSRAKNPIRNRIRNSRKRGEISGIFGLVEIGFSKFIYVRKGCLVVELPQFFACKYNLNVPFNAPGAQPAIPSEGVSSPNKEPTRSSKTTAESQNNTKSEPLIERSDHSFLLVNTT